MPSLTLLVLRCSDLQLSVRFYTALGLVLTREKHGGGPEHYSCTLGQTVLELYPATTSSTSAVRFGLRIPAASLAVAAATAIAGSVLRSDEKSVVIGDPDGHKIEISADAA